MSKIQVNREHYKYSTYITQRRWSSIWHQLSAIAHLCPKTTLEIGPGNGILKTIGKLHDIEITTVDIDPMLKPDHIGSIMDLPFEGGAFELVCAFQVLEHLEFDAAIDALSELRRITSRYVLISLPNAQLVWRYKIYFPFIGEKDFMIGRPFWRPVEHSFDGEHYWEINKKGYEISRVLSEISKILKIRSNWQLWDNPYHHFFLLEKVV